MFLFVGRPRPRPRDDLGGNDLPDGIKWPPPLLEYSVLVVGGRGGRLEGTLAVGGLGTTNKSKTEEEEIPRCVLDDIWQEIRTAFTYEGTT